MSPRPVKIQSQIRMERVEILSSQEDLRELLNSDMGYDVASFFDEILEGIHNEYQELFEVDGDDYESISDGYRNKLVDTMNALDEILQQKRLDRKRIEELYNQLYDNL
jgi:hypothetical protein